MARQKYKITQSGCWQWTAARTARGYGQSWLNGGVVPAHRLMAHLVYGGVLGTKKQALHRCGNRACINPDHLYVGDASANQRDAVADGTHANASKTHCPKGHAYALHGGQGTRSRYCRTCVAIAARIRRGWSPERARRTPIKPKKPTGGR